MQRIVIAAVHELQQLDRELDVAEPTLAELQFARLHPRGHQLLDAAAHGLHVGHEILTVTSGPDHRHQRVDVLFAQFGIADGRAGLQKCLEFPGFGPALVVRDMRLQGADQLTGLALGPQRGVDLEEGLAGEPHHLAGDAGRHRVRRLGHEDDVDVADVIQFARTAFAHRDDREPGTGLVAAHRPGGDDQCRPQRRIGQVGQVLPHRDVRQHRFVLDRRRDVQRRQHQDAVAVVGLQHMGNSGGAGRPAQFGRQPLEVLEQLGAGRQRDLAVQQSPRERVRHQVITQRQRRAQHGEQPAAQRRVGHQQRAEFGPVALEGVRDPHHGAQGAVGVRGARQRPQQRDVRVGVPAEPVQIRPRRGRHQPEAPDAGLCGALRRGVGHHPTLAHHHGVTATGIP
ncbi:Uncharacterised protein [Mycobacteroides abscessus subsp. abscessus]|nr:Uncharacterised protein [Mycobacteroides abscessus subsp. abscessus]